MTFEIKLIWWFKQGKSIKNSENLFNQRTYAQLYRNRCITRNSKINRTSQYFHNKIKIN